MSIIHNAANLIESDGDEVIGFVLCAYVKSNNLVVMSSSTDSGFTSTILERAQAALFIKAMPVITHNSPTAVQ